MWNPSSHTPEEEDEIRREIEAIEFDMLTLQDWVDRISKEDRKRLAHAMRFESQSPNDFRDVIAELRERYKFIPAEPTERK